MKGMKPGSAPLKSIRLLDQVRERITYLHYSLSTEKGFPHWVKFFIRWYRRKGAKALWAIPGQLRSLNPDQVDGAFGVAA